MNPNRRPRIDDTSNFSDSSGVSDPSEGAPPLPRAAPAAAKAEFAEMQLEVALYIESISSELRLMARAAGLDALSYFLEMARIEASIQIEKQALKTKD